MSANIWDIPHTSASNAKNQWIDSKGMDAINTNQNECNGPLCGILNKDNPNTPKIASTINTVYRLVNRYTTIENNITKKDNCKNRLLILLVYESKSGSWEYTAMTIGIHNNFQPVIGIFLKKKPMKTMLNIKAAIVPIFLCVLNPGMVYHFGLL